jgi:hypothetical protein
MRAKVSLLAVGSALTALLASGEASASVVSSHTGAWRPEDRDACLAENQSASPEVQAEREASIPRAPVVHVIGAIGVHGGLGSPAGIGGYVGHTHDGTPASMGWAGFLRADALAVRPVWLSVQTHALLTPKADAASFMTDVFVGADFHGWGNSWSEMRRKRTHEKVYDCVFGRWDVAPVLGLKRVIVAGDPRMENWYAVMGGFQMRFLRALWGGTLGIDFDVLGVFDPSTLGAGAQVTDALHVGAFVFTQEIGFTWHRGVWGTLAVGAGFDL